MADVPRILDFMTILAIIPAHNEARAIGDLVKSVKALGHHVLVIDDGSIDQTASLAQAQGAVVILTGRKSGKGNALRLGFEYAVSNGYPAVIALDGDGQHAPADIRVFIDSWQNKGADVVGGNRMQNPKGMPLVRLATNAFMSGLISLICRQKIADTQCGFRLISTEVLKNIQLVCTDFEIETEILIKAARKGYKIVSVPIQTIYGDEVSKIKPIRDTWRFVKFILKESIFGGW